LTERLAYRENAASLTMRPCHACRLLVLGAAFFTAVYDGRGQARAQASPTVEELLDRAGQYVVALQDRLAAVVSDETHRQRLSSGPRVFRRTIQAEMLYWWIAEERVWLSVRNVLSTDGYPIDDSKDRLERALKGPVVSDGTSAGAEVTETTPGAAVVARSARLRALQEEAGRFDLGFARTTGSPTEVLQFLLPEHVQHFSFTRDGQEQVGGTLAWKLGFIERGGPTVATVNNEDVESSGAIWVVEGDGAVVRTNLTLRVPRPGQKPARTPDASVTVDFQRDTKLRLWVPARMEERYRSLECTSTYRNFRRFETFGRLVPPQ
jgi:hypothetical protein